MFGSFCIRSGKSSIQILAGALVLGPITMGMIILAVCEIKYQSIQSINYIYTEIVCIKVISTLFLLPEGASGVRHLSISRTNFKEWPLDMMS